MRITYTYRSREAVLDHESEQIIIGRPLTGVAVDLDLTPDEKVSRPHARVWTEYGQYWIEDLNSTRGTQVNGEEIKGKGRQRLESGDSVSIGETTLRLDIPPDLPDKEPSPTTLPPDEPESVLVEGISQSLDAVEPAFSSAEATTDTERRLALLYELPLKFAEEGQLDQLLQLVVERAVSVIPGARRGALLINDRQTPELLLAASLPADKPAVSTTLALRAIQRREGFIWSRPAYGGDEDEPATESVPGSAFEHNIESAIYAPLLWKGEALGAICVDNHEASGAFLTDDLQLLQALAHHAASAIRHLEDEKHLRHEAKVLNNFLKLVSPQLAERLTQYQGRIRLGGEFREATILFSDIRGFTMLSSQMEAEDVSEMIAEYFGQLVPIIFKHNGMVDKYVGDAIVAVFGSPNADERQHLHAVQAGLEMQLAVAEINARRIKSGQLVGELGVGIHCGEVIHGFIGTPEHMEFTVLGDAVNRASRICDGASKGETLISYEMYQRLWKEFEVEQTTVPTKHEGNLSAYRVVAVK
ncbi:MAG TPA: adenylate/guanylate cyclase domain-containing protein [Pyrinomonadaceae bacterium]|nr:adenylate/guanylate cyclase domain-containing protein [Pyrinomonadaceae bacterium]